MDLLQAANSDGFHVSPRQSRMMHATGEPFRRWTLLPPDQPVVGHVSRWRPSESDMHDSHT